MINPAKIRKFYIHSKFFTKKKPPQRITRRCFDPLKMADVITLDDYPHSLYLLPRY